MITTCVSNNTDVVFLNKKKVKDRKNIVRKRVAEIMLRVYISCPYKTHTITDEVGEWVGHRQ